MFFGIGIDVSEKNAPLLLPLFSGKNTFVSVRDPKSLATLVKIGITQAVEIPDPALMGPVLRKARHTPKTSAFTRQKKPKIGLALRKGYLKNESDSISQILEYFESKGLECVFVNHSFHPTNKEADDKEFVKSFSNKKNYSSTQTIDESYKLYEDLDFMIAMRLHAGVIAAKNAVPFFLLSYSKKTDEFARRLSHEYVMSAKTFDFGIFAKRFDALLEHAEAESFALQEKCDILTKTTFNSYDRFFYGLEFHQRESHKAER